MTLDSTPPTARFARRLAGGLCVLGALTIAAGCGSDTRTASSTTGATGGTVAITGQWARTSPSQANTGAAYFTITSPVDDTLTGVKVDAAVAGTAEMHETVMAGSDTSMPTGTGMGTETTMAGGQMTMRPVASVALKAGTAVEFKPGGYHVMLMELKAPLVKGTTITLTLVFEKAGEITIDVPVQDEAP